MDKKAKLFTKRFAERLAKGKPKKIKKKSLLQKSIHNVSKESLKRELNNNFDLYLKYLNKCLKRLSVETPAGSNDFKLIQTWEDCQDVVGLTKQASRQLCTQVTLKELESERAYFVNILQKYEDTCDIESKEMVPAWMAATKHLLASTWNLKVITKLMLYYLSKLQSVAENCMQSGENVESITGELKKFLLMSYLRSRKMQTEEPEASSKRPDILASLLSIYIDLLVYMNRDNEKKKVSREITSLTSYLLKDLPMKLDVLIQICSPVDSTHVLTFARSCLEKIPGTLDHTTYLRVMLCLRKFHDKIPDIIENSWKVRAPLGFIDWLQDKSPEAMTQIPDDIRFKGRQITHFLLTNLSEDLQSVLEDVLTDRQAVSDLMLDDEQQDDLKDDDGGGDKCDPDEEQPLFVMDRRKSTDDRKSKQKAEGIKLNRTKSSSDQDQEEMDIEAEGEAEGEDVETSQTVDNTAEVEVIDLSNVLSAIYDNKPNQYIGTEYVSTSSQDSPRKKSKSPFNLPATKTRKSSKLKKLDRVDEIVLDTSDADEAKDMIVPNLAAHLKHGEQVVPDIFIVDDTEAAKAESFTQMKTKGKESITVSITSPETVDSESEDFTLVQMLSPNKKATPVGSNEGDVSFQNVKQISGKGKKRLSSVSSLEDNVISPKRTASVKDSGTSPSILKVNSINQSPNSAAVIEIEDTDSAIDTDKEKDLLGSRKGNSSRLTASNQKETSDSDKEQRRKMRDSDSSSRKPTSSVQQQDGSTGGMGLRTRRRSANSASESELAREPSEQQISSPKLNMPNSPVKDSLSSSNTVSKKVSDSKILSPFIKPRSTVRDAITRSRKNSEKEDASPSRSPRGSKKSSDEDVCSPARSPSRSKKNSVEEAAVTLRSTRGSKKSSDEDVSSPVRGPTSSKKSDEEAAGLLRSPQGSKKSSDEDVCSPVRSPSRSKNISDEEAASPLRSPRGSQKNLATGDAIPFTTLSLNKDSNEKAVKPVRSPRRRSSTSLSLDETEPLTDTPRSPRMKHELESSVVPSLETSPTSGKSEGNISSARPQLFSPERQSSPVKKPAPDNGSVTLKTPSRTPQRKSAMSAQEMSSVAKEAKILHADIISEDDVRKSSRKRRSTRIETDDEDSGPKVKTPRKRKKGSKLDESSGTESGDVFSSPAKLNRKVCMSRNRSSDGSSKAKITELTSSSDQDIEAASPNSLKKMKMADGCKIDVPEVSFDSQPVKTNHNTTPGKTTVRQTPTKRDVNTPRRSSRSAIIDSPMVTRSGRKVKTPKKGKITPAATPSSKSMQTIREDDEDGEVVFNMTPAKQRKGGRLTTPHRSTRKKRQE